MLTSEFQFQKYGRLFRLGSCIFLTIIFLIPLFVCTMFFLSPEDEEVTEIVLLPRESFRGQIITALADYPFVPLPKIEDKLLYVDCNQRPDSVMGSILLGLKSGDERVADLGERIYFHSLEGDEIAFSSEPTPFWIEPKSVKEGALEVAFTTQFEGVYENCSQFVVQKSSRKKAEDEVFRWPAFMKVLPPDRLLDLYGGEVFKEEKGRLRLEIGEKQPQVFYIKDGDRFAFSQGKWKEEKDTRGLPLLMIQVVNSQKCDYVLYSSDGFSLKKGSLPVERVNPLLVKPSDLFPKLYPRSGNSVICQVRQESMVVRGGDWLLRSKGSFQHLDTLDAIKQVLTFSLPGELFICDGLQQRDNKTYFVGHLFDEKRTSEQKIELLLTEKKIQKIPKNKVSLIE